jgi:steroid 5-alpha reductase family enzyme
MKSSNTACNFADWVCALLFLSFLIFETIADQQHWNFHAKKYAVTESQRSLHPDPDVRDGFYQSGLFRFCRHPNYFAEQSQWLCIYAFTLTQRNITQPLDLINIYSLGAILLILLFQGSMHFSESITISKYPKYTAYKARTNQCIPFFSSARVEKDI